MTEPTPAVSVVIPTHSRWHLLERTLHGALRQEGVAHEVVVVDDGSKDVTPERLAALADDEPRLRLVRHETGRGVAHARNAGIAQARGAWVAFLDDDDLWAPHKLRDQLAAAERDPAAGWVYAAAVVVDGEDRVIGVEEPVDAAAMPAALRRFNAVPGGCSSVLARRDVLERAGGFDPGLRVFADWDMWLRLMAQAPPAQAPGHPVAYVKHGANMHMAEAGRVEAELGDLLDRHPEIDLDGVWLSRWLAGGHRGAGDRRAAAGAYLRGAVRHRIPGNLVRALGVLVAEPAMDAFRARRRAAAPPPPEPPWLAGYPRPAAASASS
jgi:glycosyltransferase involved in cell wall biosynthesis